jgi:hypothetical protein
MKFSHSTKAHLGHYVYGLVDPTTKTIFYVGKASANNRAFDHLRAKSDEKEKEKRICQIRAAKQEPVVEILRYGLGSEKQSFEVEAAIIDAIGIENLTNAVRGHGVERGRLSAAEAERLHGSEPVAVESLRDPFMLFFIHQTYSPTLTEQQLYDNIRQFWSGVAAGTRAPRTGRLRYPVALGVVDSVVIRAYSVAAWFRAGTTFSSRPCPAPSSEERWEFVGNVITPHRLAGKRLTTAGQPIRANQQGYGYIKPAQDA